MKGLFTSFLFVYVCLAADVYGQATDVCLSCLMRHNPIDGCATYPEIGTFCGPFRIGINYFTECKHGVPEKNFEKCTSNVECATKCVLAYQRFHAKRCLDNRRSLEGDNYQQLTCADYGRMHFGGPSACGLADTDEISLYLKNLTSLCGCLTIYGSCDLVDSTTPNTQQDGLLLVYIIAPLCAVVVIIAIIICSLYAYRYQQRRKRHKKALEDAGLPQAEPDVEKAKKKPARIASAMNDYMMSSTSEGKKEITSEITAAGQYEDPISFDDRIADGSSHGSGEKTSEVKVQMPHTYENSPVIQLAPRVEKGSRLPIPTPRQQAVNNSPASGRRFIA